MNGVFLTVWYITGFGDTLVARGEGGLAPEDLEPWNFIPDSLVEESQTLPADFRQAKQVPKRKKG